MIYELHSLVKGICIVIGMIFRKKQALCFLDINLIQKCTVMHELHIVPRVFKSRCGLLKKKRERETTNIIVVVVSL